MGRHRRVLILCALAGALVAVASAAPAALAVGVRTSSGQFLGVMPRAGINPASIPGSLARRPSGAKSLSEPTSNANGNVAYQGGPVLHTIKPYLIFWDPSGTGISTQSRSVLEQYLTDVATDTTGNDTYGVARQYFDSTGYAAQSQAFVTAQQAIPDTTTFPTHSSAACPEPTGFSSCITDADMQSEVARLISTKALPSGIGAGAPIYFIITPVTTNVCDPNGFCAAGNFCAYHSSFIDGGAQVLYSTVPFAVWANGSTKGCQDDGNPVYQSPNSDQADQVADNLSHELNETITDPLGTAWVNFPGGDGLELADKCQAYAAVADPTNGYSPHAYTPLLGGAEASGTLYDQSINGDHYYTQTLWSNGDADCEASPGSLLYPSPPPAVTASFTAPARAASGNAVSFDGSASTADSGGFSSATWSFGDGGSTFISSGSTGPASHTYAHPGTYNVSLTVVDTHGDVSTVSHQLSVGSPPAASFTATPAAAQTGQAIAFDGSASSDPNASTIASYAWNFGDGTTGTGVKPTHAYARVGTYTVSLVVTDALGFASPAVTKTIRIANPPVAVFSVPGSPVAGSSAAFDASGSSDPNGVILTNYAWSFGDGGSGTGVKPSHVYARPGTYTVTLTVTDADGLQSSHSATVTVAPAPRIVSVRGRRAGHSAVLLVKVSAPGTVRAGRHSARLRRAGTATIALTLSKAQRRALGHHHSVRVKVTIVYVPAVGPRITTKRTVTIKP